MNAPLGAVIDAAERIQELERELAELRAGSGSSLSPIKTYDASDSHHNVAMLLIIATEFEKIGYHVGIRFERDRDDRITGITIGTGEKRQ